MTLLLSTTTSKQPSVFNTAFDPSDLPGKSIDPLGFERGYLLLADKILPGFTNVANNPRYLSMLCGGVYLAKVSPTDSPQVQYRKRLNAVLRLERFWGLACELASRKCGVEIPPSNGIRGISYVRRHLDYLAQQNPTKLDSDFDLLSRQIPYGVIGIYAAVADGMVLLDRKTLHLTTDLGEQLGREFLESTEIPKSLRRAVIDDTSVGKKTLIDWGENSHVSNELFAGEKKYLSQAVNREPIRSRMLQALESVPRKKDENEQSWLKRVLPELKRSEENIELVEATRAILEFEKCFRLAMLGFERLLFLCKFHPQLKLKERDLEEDPVLNNVCRQLPRAVSRLQQLVESATTDEFHRHLDRLADVRQFLQSASLASHSVVALVDAILLRHIEVQHGKFDKGRRKMPWLAKSSQGISQTVTKGGGLSFEAKRAQDIVAHPYRLGTAEAFITALA